MKRIDEKTSRVKYIRALERFSKSAIAILKRDDFDEKLFRERVTKNLEILQKAEKTYLDNPYTKALEEFASSVIALKDRDTLIKEANLLDKLKNQKTYKKEKHKFNKFRDEF
ncbi:MAG: hypothetical protein GX282_06585 [Campylobacteraceae bacterium]|nr:hypothetical protein [Campylobacteraceae bacterium]